MSRLGTARTALHTALLPVLPEGRVSLFPPSSIVSPCVYIESPSGALVDSGNVGLVRATFPVVAIADGDQQPMVLALDELTARVWDACRTAANANPTSWTAGTVDVGGVNQRCVTITVEVTITARTLCDPPLN